jgi:hypothetical protein
VPVASDTGHMVFLPVCAAALSRRARRPRGARPVIESADLVNSKSRRTAAGHGCAGRPAVEPRRRIRVDHHPDVPTTRLRPTTNWPHRRSRSPRSGLPRHASRGSAYNRSSAGTGPQGQPHKDPTPIDGLARTRCGSRRPVSLRARRTPRSRASGAGAPARSGRRPTRGRAGTRRRSAPQRDRAPTAGATKLRQLNP